MVGLNKRQRRSSVDEVADLLVSENIEDGSKKVKRSYRKRTIKNPSKVFTLPKELLDDILGYCERRDLLSLCRTSEAFYCLAMPALYREYVPRQPAELVKFVKRINRGIGPIKSNRKQMTDEIVKGIKLIDLRWFDNTFCRASQEKHKRRSYDKQAGRTLRSLIELVKRAENL